MAASRTIDTSRLDAALSRLAQAFERTDDRAARVQASFDFHTELVRLCGNSRIIASYTLITTQVKLCMSMNLRKLDERETPGENVARHQRLRDVLLSEDPDTALQAIADHGHDSFARKSHQRPAS